MKSMLLGVVPFLFLQVGGGGGGGETNHCIGCDDTSTIPDFYDQQIGSCVSYTTAALTNWRDGDCMEAVSVCDSEPCTPELVLTHHQSSSGCGGDLKGGMGSMTFGPLKFPNGNNVEIYRGGGTVLCGGSVPYYFEITGYCPETNNVELVYGELSCSRCERQ